MMNKRQVSHTEFIHSFLLGARWKRKRVSLKDQLSMSTLVLDISGLARLLHRDVWREREIGLALCLPCKYLIGTPCSHDQLLISLLQTGPKPVCYFPLDDFFHLNYLEAIVSCSERQRKSRLPRFNLKK